MQITKSTQKSHSGRSRRPRVVCVSDFAECDWYWLKPHMPECDWQFIRGPLDGGLRGQPGLLRACWNAVRAAEREPERTVLVSHGSRVGLRCAAIRRLLGAKVPHINYTFHFEHIPSGFKKALIRRTIPGFDRLVVYTTLEKERYHALFNLPAGKIEMIHWGASEPAALDDDATAIETGDYICAIGANARDYVSLIEAVRRRPDIRLVAVVRPRSLEGIDVPENVTVHTNIPQADCWNILAHARFMVLPLTPEASAGHSVLVQTMFLKKPFIVSDTPATGDYIRDDETALVYPSGDIDALEKAIGRLWQDDVLRQRLATGSQAFAREYCSEARVVAHFRQFLRENARG